MKVLLDTHILLWWLAADKALRPRAARVIADSDTVVVVSSVWEVAVKKAVGLLDAPDDLLDALDASAFDTLAITAPHAMEAGALPPYPADPFDRMLIAPEKILALQATTRDGLGRTPTTR